MAKISCNRVAMATEGVIPWLGNGLGRLGGVLVFVKHISSRPVIGRARLEECTPRFCRLALARHAVVIHVAHAWRFRIVV
jgi:hypothetical protein